MIDDLRQSLARQADHRDQAGCALFVLRIVQRRGTSTSESHVRSWFRRCDTNFPHLTVVPTVSQTVGLRSPDHTRHPPDRDFTCFRRATGTGMWVAPENLLVQQVQFASSLCLVSWLSVASATWLAAEVIRSSEAGVTVRCCSCPFFVSSHNQAADDL